MGPPSHVWSVVDQNIIKRRMTALSCTTKEIHKIKNTLNGYKALTSCTHLHYSFFFFAPGEVVLNDLM